MKCVINTEREARRSNFPKLERAYGKYFTTDEKAYLFPILVLWTGSDEKSANWLLYERISACGNKTGFELCSNNQSEAFINYIRHIELGGFA